MFDSLLWLEKSETQKIDSSVIKDLNLHKVYERLIQMSEENEALIYNLCMDEATIMYRQDILTDFLASPSLILDLEKNLEGFRELNSKESKAKNKLSNLYTLIDLVVRVETSIDCVEALNQTLLYYQLKSKGLLNLRQDVENIMNTKEFKQMKKDLKEIRYIFCGIRGVEVSINMSTGMRPYEAQITKVNDYKYRYPKAFRKVSTAIEVNDQFLGNPIKNYAPVFPIGKLEWDLLDEIEFALREHKSDLAAFVERYESIDTKPFITLLQEITFYNSSCDMIRYLNSEGLPLCKPKLLEAIERRMILKDCYNVSLAYENLGDGEYPNKIILNDFQIGPEGRIVILTGANRGGKTTITQAIGQIQVFAQLGLLVPAKEAEISLVDGIYTHFPLLEKDSVDYGKFGKECDMFNKLFHQATDRSLLLLNESFSGTSHLESLKIAEDVVKAVKFKRICMIYNTHLHELGITAYKYNLEMSNDTGIISLITGFEKGENTYKVYEGKPLGKSHAREIAEKYHITYEQLVKRLEEKA